MIYEKPGRLYKYLTAERIDVLRNGTIRFTQPGALNDPFEHSAKLASLAESSPRDGVEAAPSDAPGLLRALFKHTFATFIQASEPALRQVGYGDRYAVLSLSERDDSLLMWAHYADEHRGFAIEFDTSHVFFDHRSSPEDLFNHVQRVAYQLERPTLSLEAYSQALLFKSPHWEYEQEWRMVVSTKDAAKKIETAVGDVYLYSFPPECVSAVILGSRIPEPIAKGFLDLVMTDNRYAHVAVRFARRDPDRYAVQIAGEGRVHYLRALQAAESGDEEALKVGLNRAIELEPEEAEYCFLRGLFAALKGYADKESPGSEAFQAARRDLERTVELNPFSSMYWLMLYEVAEFQGDDRRALEAIGRASERSPEDAGLLERRAKFLCDRKSYPGAIQDCTQALKIGPPSANAYWLRACAYKEEGRLDEAMADTNGAIELAPDRVKFYRARAKLWEKKENIEQALADLSHALGLEPDQADALQERARLRYLSGGDAKATLADIERAMELLPGDATLKDLHTRLSQAHGSSD